MLDRKVILIGYSGHGLAMVDIALENKLELLGYSDLNENENNYFNLKFLGNEKDENFIGWKDDIVFIIGIGNNHKREQIYNYIKKKGKLINSLISNKSNISVTAIIGNGVFINKNVCVNAFVKIGENVILNTGCIIEHNCVISKSVHVAPGCVLAGNVKVGERSFIGANSVIKQGVNIGKDVIVGAGSVVIKDVLDGEKVVGNPSRSI